MQKSRRTREELFSQRVEVICSRGAVRKINCVPLEMLIASHSLSLTNHITLSSNDLGSGLFGVVVFNWREFGLLAEKIGKSYRVGSRAQANFSPPTFKPVHGARAGQCAALSVQLSQLQLRCSPLISGPQASSSSGELSAKRATKNVIDFCRADRNLTSKSLASYFQSKKRKSEVVRRSLKNGKKNSSIDLRRAFTCASVDRSSMSSASVAAGLFPNLSCLVSLIYSLLTEAVYCTKCAFFFFDNNVLNQTFLRADGGLAESPCLWRVNHHSAKLVVDSFQLCFGHG